MQVRMCGFIFLLMLAFNAPTSASATAMVKIESISWEEVCGVDANDKTVCIQSNGSPIFIPDTVTSLAEGFSNQYFSCGVEASSSPFDAVKCWKEVLGSGTVNGDPIPTAVRRFLQITRPESVRISSNSACGIDKNSGELYCFLPDWRPRLISGAIRIKPATGITAIGLDSDTICWGDGSSAAESKIACQSNGVGWQWPRDMKLKGLLEIVVIQDRMCARSKAEAYCWGPKGKIRLSTDLVIARSWNRASDSLCALTQDSRVACFDPVTGTILPAGFGHSIPSDYATPNPSLKQLWTSPNGACVLDTSGLVNCWEWWNTYAAPIVFSRKVEKLFGMNSQPCARLDDGQVECRLYSYDSRTLKNADRVRVTFSGWNKCFWNSSGVDCRNRVDQFSFSAVTDFATSPQGESICAIGSPTFDPAPVPVVQCSSYDAAMKSPPHLLSNPTSVATTAEQVCALSDEGLTCWGTPYAETPYPTTVIAAKRLAMSDRHACVLDQFGLACWGELSALDLAVPAGLDQPGRVVDVAVGSSRTCAVLDTGTVECWGRDFELSGPPPLLKGATSILGRGGLFCALDSTGLHCWGGDTNFPK